MTPARKPKLLLVDDRPENLLALNTILRDEYELVECLSGIEALALVKDHDFTAILLDVQMPTLDGYETARLIRGEKRSELTPILFITAINREDAHERKGYFAGAVDYLFKPIDPEILQAKLRVFAQLERQAQLLKDQAVQAKENEFLREMLKTRDQFLSMASHELKTPITPLSLQLDAFKDLLEQGRLESVPTEKLVRMLVTSRNQVRRLSKTIDELLDVSRFATGTFELKKEDCDLGETISRVTEGFAEQLRSSGVDCSLQIEPGVRGYWDSFRIEQVYINLLTNAIKYGDRKPIEVSVSSQGSYARLSVRDHGIGIELEDRQRIFNRFERAASPKNFSGLGLGLYIANQIADLHGGTISLESERGKGSTFFVNLPLNTEAPSKNESLS